MPYGDISGYGDGKVRGRGRRVVGSADFYHLPKEMTESTKVGVIMSLLAIFVMITLFICETWAFIHTKISSTIDIDPNADHLVRMNFNVTLYDVQCDFVSVDVWDTLGTNLQNVTKDITKWNLDQHGTQKKFHGRNKHERAVVHEEHEETLQDIAAMNSGELHSVDLSPEIAPKFYEENELAMVDFFAPWCIWCQRLAPTWEKFAAEVKTKRINLGVGKVDCVENQQMCKDERVMAFPTLRWYENGKAVMPDYRGDRTVDALIEYAKNRVDKAKGGDDDEEGSDEEEHHPGCQVSGHIMVNRVPGNLHMEAKSTNHVINSVMTNLTHRVNHLSFGTPGGLQGHWMHMYASNGLGDYTHTNPMKEKLYITEHFHQAWHHHMKIVSTHIDYLFSYRNMVIYQILEESQLVLYDVQEIPEIKFLWDMSPMSVNLKKEGRMWYDYVTNLLAIIGGTYTTLGLINATLLKILKPKSL